MAEGIRNMAESHRNAASEKRCDPRPVLMITAPAPHPGI
jgi:hypothetical protein